MKLICFNKTFRSLFVAAHILLFWQPTHAQNLLNPSFDSVYFGGIDRLLEWVTADGFRMHAGSNNADTVNALQPNTFYDATGLAFSAYLWLNNQFSYSPISMAATELINRPNWVKEDGTVFESFVINGNRLYTNASGYPDLSRCGIPFTGRPTKLTGFYRFTDSTATLNNFGKCVILAKKWNAALHKSDTIAYTVSTSLLNPQSAVMPFEIALNYVSTAVPDTMMVAFFAATNTQNPSVLWLDNLSFTYSGIGFEEEENHDFKLFPNPTTGMIWVEKALEQPADFKLYNALGALVLTGKLQSELNIQDLPSGLYTLKIHFANGTIWTEKLLKF